MKQEDVKKIFEWERMLIGEHAARNRALIRESRYYDILEEIFTESQGKNVEEIITLMLYKLIKNDIITRIISDSLVDALFLFLADKKAGIVTTLKEGLKEDGV